MSTSASLLQRFLNNPLAMLVRVMDLTPYERSLREQEGSLTLLTGLMCFSHLPTNHRSKLKEAILRLPDQRLADKLNVMLAVSTSQPFWFNWQLDDEALNEHFTGSRRLQDAITQIGLESTDKLTLESLAMALLGATQGGIKNARGAQLSESHPSTPGADQAIVIVLIEMVRLMAGEDQTGTAERMLRQGGLTELLIAA
ncbi:hypothetical protein WH50_25390 [Pokkaliibacter plantistimulans]|uniref:Uncharacterized protein n=1 Tax=Pokkaliibacter plantistimulans TaxID=1635171 RepID=A0ABX5LQX9_9GAMM|nr:hypothetical protein [Pokkaliibacter plantistimulans]PXF28607.1 hypothetical protein WH50_25390 [Pokkaliibacter plantistimulans]